MRTQGLESEATAGVEDVGSGDWVRDRLATLPADTGCSTGPGARELTDWLYAVVRRNVSQARLAAADRSDVVQDAMATLASSLRASPQRYCEVDNPAAVLERAAARAVAAGWHRARMVGLSGVAPNGRNWRASYPRRVGGEAARYIFEELPAPEYEPCREIEAAAAQVSQWTLDHLGVELPADTVHAVVYVLDRVVAGVSRSALLRGGHSALAADPAMRHLGFGPSEATTFGAWLLGRVDARHDFPSVLDAAMQDDEPDAVSVQRWRRFALRAGFAVTGPVVHGAAGRVAPTRRTA